MTPEEPRKDHNLVLHLTESEMQAIAAVEDAEHLATYARAIHYLLALGLRLWTARQAITGEPKYLNLSHGLEAFSREQST